MENRSENISLADILASVRYTYNLLIAKWKLFLVVGLLGGIAGITYATLRETEYKATLSFMVNENEGGVSSSLSSLAGLAGLSGANSGSLSDDKILFMANSRIILGSTLLSSKTIAGKNDLLANHFLVMTDMVSGFKKDTALNGFVHFTHDKLEDLTYQENKVLDKIIKVILESKMLVFTAKKKAGLVAQSAGIMVVDFTSGSEEFAKYFIEDIYAKLSSYYINRTTQRQLRNYNLVKARADSIKDLLSQKEETGAEFYDRNVNIVKMRSRVNSDRIRKEIELLTMMFGEVLKNLEVAKFALENQTPVFQVIDSPTFPLEAKKLSRTKFGLIGGIVAGLIYATYLVIENMIRRSRYGSAISKNPTPLS